MKIVLYSEEQRQLYRDRLDDLNTEKQVRLEKLSQYRKDLETQVARIKQTIEKVLYKNRLAVSLKDLLERLSWKVLLVLFQVF